ncbi:MAG: NAD-dependent epimerase/dehydratase family protein [Bacteroidota bacterium]|nr:NAD-dependent epimerase/dehydratase family protein [Bacteroidota bacterium]MDP4232699.1 NAD-dependent epimerase/dehydratase family protein [Bacteroidota bacterium]MDP4243168.1 NAD-dependent epimerase/dehydratase family protein [Bacteroidota bacterium]MDP4287625.1 NAD-dependent epimerase/dehydratase family protein [Bacteroidota bacterium]
MKILITGGAGFIGSHTADALIERGDEVVLLDNLSKPVHLKGIPTYLHPKARLIIGDVRDPKVFLDALNGVEKVVHLAAYQDYLPDFSTFFSVNAVGTALLYELIVAHKLPVKRVVVASSQAVNGEGLYKCEQHGLQGPTARPIGQLEHGDWAMRCAICGEAMQWQWTPESFSHPENQYALSKESQEKMTLSFGRRYDIPSVALRYSIVQGPRQSFYNAYSGACRIFALHYYFRKAPTIYEDGQMHRDFINIHDVVNANLMALEDERMVGEQFCVGGGLAYTVSEFDRIVARISGCEDVQPSLPGAFRFGDTRNSCSDISKLKALGWNPSRQVEESVRDYVEWLREQADVEDIFEFAERNMRSLNVVRQSAN